VVVVVAGWQVAVGDGDGLKKKTFMSQKSQLEGYLRLEVEVTFQYNQ